MSQGPSLDLDRWHDALTSVGDVNSVNRLSWIDGLEPRVRLLEARADRDQVGHRWWLGGDRSRISTGCARLLTDVAGADQRWWLQWVTGRWPRGLVIVGQRLDRDDCDLSIGIVAPLGPTRLALSEGPLPLPIDCVAHFKALHSATGRPGLSGCRLDAAGGEAQAVAARWEVDQDGLSAAADHLGMSDLLTNYAKPALDGLQAAMKRPPTLVLEASYRPEPATVLVVEIGPVGAARAAGLAEAVLGQAAGDAIRDLSQRLDQPALTRLRLEIDQEGFSALSALASPQGQSVRIGW